MLSIKKFDSNLLQCVTYVAIHNDTALIVESSGQVAEIVSYLQEQLVKQVVLAYTHGHFDHVAYGQALQRALRAAHITCKTYAPRLDDAYFGTSGIQVLRENLEMFGLAQEYANAALPHIDTFYQDQESLPFLDFVVIATPGHTPGSCCLYSASQKIMFTGDTLFAFGGTGRTDLPGGSAHALDQSLQKIAQYPADTIVYPGHGPQDALKNSCQTAGVC